MSSVFYCAQRRFGNQCSHYEDDCDDHPECNGIEDEFKVDKYGDIIDGVVDKK